MLVQESTAEALNMLSVLTRIELNVAISNRIEEKEDRLWDFDNLDTFYSVILVV